MTLVNTEVRYRNLWWRATNENNGYVAIERGARSLTISRKLVTGQRAVQAKVRPCGHCGRRHKTYEWCVKETRNG